MNILSTALKTALSEQSARVDLMLVRALGKQGSAELVRQLLQEGDLDGGGLEASVLRAQVPTEEFRKKKDRGVCGG